MKKKSIEVIFRGLCCFVSMLRFSVILLRCFAFLLSILFVILLPGRQRVVWHNLTLVFPKDGFCRRFYRWVMHVVSLGQGIVESILIWTVPDAWCEQRVNVDELSRTRLQSMKGVLLLTPHMHTLEMLPRILARHGCLMHFVYKANLNDGWVEQITAKRVQYAQSLSHKDVRQMYRCLKEGGNLGVLPDQCMRGMTHVRVPFLGVPSWTITAPVRLRHQLNVPVWVVVCYRERFAKQYRLRLEPIASEAWSGHITEDVASMNRYLSEFILQDEASYYWVHKRFKTDDPYQKRTSVEA